MKKNNFIFIMLFLLIVVLVFSVTITYLVIQKSMSGTGIVETDYYDILFTNTSMDFNSKMEVSINDEEDKISIKIPDVNEFLEENSFTIDVRNIGNIDAYVDRMFPSPASIGATSARPSSAPVCLSSATPESSWGISLTRA